MRPPPYLSVILPVHNERENILLLLEEITQVLHHEAIDFEIIAVDDGSTDGSLEKLKTALAKFSELKVIVFRRNCGQAAAIDAGFRFASGEILATMDADLQNDPHDLPGMVRKLEAGFDCVAGWRKNRQDKFFLRRLPSAIANAVIRRLWRSRLNDLGCSLKVYRRELTQELSLYGEMHRYLNILIEGMGARVASIPVNHRPRIHGKSKYSLTRIPKVILDIMTIWFLQGFRTKPLHVFGGVAALCFGGSFLTGLIATVQKCLWEFSLNRNPLFLLAIFLTVIGVQFVVLGLLAELIIRNHFESSGKIPYLIRERWGFQEPVSHARHESHASLSLNDLPRARAS